MEDAKKVSTTKLVVIDTKTRVARAFVGNEFGGEANLPDPNDEGEDGNFTAAQLIPQLNEFRESADVLRVKAKEKADKIAATGKRFVELTTEFDTWFTVFHPAEEIDTFGL